jgi:hypothetical protein
VSRGRAATLLAAALATAGAAGADCTLPADATPVAGSGDIRLAWQAQPPQLQVGQPFALLISVCPADTPLLGVDARMPEHRHGMNYRPSVQSLGGGRWRAEGLLWHMSGRWEMDLVVQTAAGRESFRHSVTLP